MTLKTNRHRKLLRHKIHIQQKQRRNNTEDIEDTENTKDIEDTGGPKDIENLIDTKDT
jgi:hypothetical protein